MKHNHIIFFLAIATVTLMTSVSAMAGEYTLGFMMVTAKNAVDSIPNLIGFFAYLTGVIFAAIGLHKLRHHVEYGPQKVELPEPLKYLFAGGLMFALPTIAYVAVETFGGIGDGQDVTGGGANAWTTGGDEVGPGLDGMLLGFMQDIYAPSLILIEFFCMAAGALLMVIAIHRFTKTAQEGPRGPTGLGTIATFVLAGVLFSIGPSIGTITETLFGERESQLQANFMALNESMGVEGSEHAQTVATSILMFLLIVGALSFVKGLFVLRGVAEGDQQSTMLSGLSHMIAGAILVNFGQFANIVQNTFGINDYGVLFY